MSLLMDFIHGVIAVIGLIIGRLIGDAITSGSSILSVILAIIGLIIAGWGMKIKGIGGAFVIGAGLGLASPITILISGKP